MIIEPQNQTIPLAGDDVNQSQIPRFSGLIPFLDGNTQPPPNFDDKVMQPPQPIPLVQQIQQPVQQLIQQPIQQPVQQSDIPLNPNFSTDIVNSLHMKKLDKEKKPEKMGKDRVVNVIKYPLSPMKHTKIPKAAGSPSTLSKMVNVSPKYSPKNSPRNSPTRMDKPKLVDNTKMQISAQELSEMKTAHKTTPMPQASSKHLFGNHLREFQQNRPQQQLSIHPVSTAQQNSQGQGDGKPTGYPISPFNSSDEGLRERTRKAKIVQQMSWARDEKKLEEIIKENEKINPAEIFGTRPIIVREGSVSNFVGKDAVNAKKFLQRNRSMVWG
ncbi:hypothetical protein EIN_084780 [Entamoeba invadens IP1]|uniref:hypothetical protein n=1 Tax=Entamoeba invadens IP1 TaxID=370355 RepID=UPI0002C3F201|nr:hypothetical protein EIN_084780 [Entamoeba invadens IP1]ELP85276.1 hypothetical protein EIN_084780 [Entamoeba invadens IP1]|eukprot:XP_004184622.1 hypothetical protein EIN_084780 [Entamoeba invadens IP1]